LSKLWKYNAKALPEGTMRTWGGQQYKKEGGEWVTVKRGKSKEKEEQQPSYPKDLTKMTPEQQKSSQAYFDKLPDKELSKRLDIVRSQRKQAIDYLDRLYPEGDYKKKDFLKRPVIKGDTRRYMKGIENLDVMEDQIIRARVKKFKD
jgi:hypothetical protein